VTGFRIKRLDEQEFLRAMFRALTLQEPKAIHAWAEISLGRIACVRQRP
jgi:hypothetical protein